MTGARDRVARPLWGRRLPPRAAGHQHHLWAGLGRTELAPTELPWVGAGPLVYSKILSSCPSLWSFWGWDHKKGISHLETGVFLPPCGLPSGALCRRYPCRTAVVDLVVLLRLLFPNTTFWFLDYLQSYFLPVQQLLQFFRPASSIRIRCGLLSLAPFNLFAGFTWHIFMGN